MICYRDMTFCLFWRECRDGFDCPRALLPRDEAQAEEKGMYISVFADRPDCFVEVDEK